MTIPGGKLSGNLPARTEPIKPSSRRDESHKRKYACSHLLTGGYVAQGDTYTGLPELLTVKP